MANHYQSILIAVDGSKEAEYAFRKSIDIAKRNKGSKLTILHVINNRALESYAPSVVEDVQQSSEALVNDCKVQAEAEGLDNVSAVIQYGAPKVLIPNEAAESANADIIVCGATGLNAVERFIMGSVSEAIVRSAKCDVIVVRTPEE